MGVLRKLESSTIARAIVCVYFVSGVTTLAYEVLWARMLSLQFGVSIFGVVITVSAFMLGLGAGSLLGARLRNFRRPLLLFAFLEAGIALFALALPWLFNFVDTLAAMSTVDAGLDMWYGLQAVIVLLVLFIPATAMGLGFPLILKVLAGSQTGLGKIYGINALGGAFGALIPLVLLPQYGWSTSVYIVAGIGGAVALVALLLAKAPLLPIAFPSPFNPTLVRHKGQTLSLLAYSGVGAASLMLEIGWTRLFGMLLLRTEYVLGIILFVFLMGMALGSLLAKHINRVKSLAVLPLIVAGFSVLGLWGLPWLAEWVETVRFSSLTTALVWQGFAVTLLTFPVTLALGAWLPLLSDHLQESTGVIGARLYGVNAVGAAIGAASAGFILIPTIGTPATISLAALILFVCGMMWSNSRLAWLAVVVVLALAWPVAELAPVSTLLPITQSNTREVYRYEDAVSMTHVVEREDGQRLLLGDLQRMDASSDPAAVAAQRNQARLPLMLHADPHSVLFLGVGTGISASGTLAYPNLKRVGVELSQGAINAAKMWFSEVNLDVLQNMTIVHDDARRFLRTTTDNYDVIIGDLFHPDLVGRSALLSVQQFSRAKARLTEQGLFVQWLALNQFDQDSLNVVLRSFQYVFPNALLFLDGFRLALVGPNGRLPDASTMLAKIQQLNDQQRDSLTGGEGLWTWLGRYFGPIPQTTGSLQDEWAPYIEFRLPKVRYEKEFNVALLLESLLKIRPTLDQAATALGVSSQFSELFERGYVAVELATQSWIASLGGRAEEADRLIRFAYAANSQDRWVGFDLADRMLGTLSQAMSAGYSRREALQRILQIRADHEVALRELWVLAETEGDVAAAAKYWQKLATISPLSLEVRSKNKVE